MALGSLSSYLGSVRVLGIETSTSQAGVALLEGGGKLVLERASARPKQSAERLLPLIAALLAEAGWPASSLDRIGVSIGPGSFTGLRVGIACAQGLSLGLGIPLVGVTSLRAMARAVPETLPGLRVPVLDARRAEVFAGAYEAGPRAAERLAPFAVAAELAAERLRAELPEPLVWVGSGLTLCGLQTAAASGADEPSAFWVGLLAEELEPSEHPPVPVYVRDAGATLPDLGTPAVTE
ncbi:MAG: tRNA (adenosine(37)-N6)-threonylcarbamoyltransferase complex dimerization subunit type 1 TsaB [Myxococcales bacterium]|nr:MAG: tRNA (adenosine(37)-N6)-threonylcarbamoyltransferase complex dimerization subunit type 1 TsaB [Myxococcales bacterium]